MEGYSQQYPEVLIKQLGSGGVNSWKAFNKWLSLQDSLDRADISHKDVAFVIRVIIIQFKNALLLFQLVFFQELMKRFDDYGSLDVHAQRILLDTLCSVMNQTTFKQYFQHHSEIYSKILSASVLCLKDSTDLLLVLKSSSAILKFFDDFASHFLDTLFVPFVMTAARFVDNADVVREVSYIFQKVSVFYNIY